MQRWSYIVIALAPITTAACAANFHDYVASVASDKMSCPKEKISLTPADPEGYEEAYGAEGCGHKATFAGRCSLGMCSSQMLPSPEARAAAERNRAASPESPDTRGKPRGPQTVSLQVANRCPREVKMFVGRDPRNSSGTSTSMSSNEVRNFPMNEGDTLWIVDDSGRPLSSTSASGGPFVHMKILESCTGFAPE
jgi:hypothetical protein